MKKYFLIFILICGGIIFSQVVLAQVSIGVTPLTFELTANPGDVLTNQLKVYNGSDNTTTIKMEIEDIAPAGEMGEVIPIPERETYSLAHWVTTQPSEFTLQPREERYVAFTISVPKNAEPGGHYGTVLARTTAVAAPGATGVGIITRTGVLVLLSVSGQSKEELAVKDFTAPKYSQYGPINFAIRLENKGTVHVKPRAQIVVTDWLGKKVGEIAIPERNVLPGAIRKFDASLDKKWLWAGRYTATLTGNYGSLNLSLPAAVITFWAFPWKIGLVILAVIILIILSRKRWIAAFRVLVKGERG